MPTSIKKIIKKKGHIFSETLNNWRYIVGNELFKVCYPKSFKNSNKFGVSTLFVMVRRGKEVELEYSKKQIIDKMNTFFGYSVVEKIKLVSFNNFLDKPKKDNTRDTNVTNSKYMNKLLDIKNDKIKKSLIEFTKLFKQK